MPSSSPYLLTTPEHVTGLWKALSKKLGSKVVRKRSRVIMRIAAFFVMLATPMSKEQFLDDYVTSFFRRIFVPFKLGVESGASSVSWPLPWQLTLAVHEHQHIVQAQRDGYFRYAWRYLRSTRKRALYEAEAFVAEYIFAGAVGIPRVPIADRLLALRQYGVSADDIQIALAYATDRIQEGSAGLWVPTPGTQPPRAADLALEWWMEQGYPIVSDGEGPHGG